MQGGKPPEPTRKCGNVVLNHSWECFHYICVLPSSEIIALSQLNTEAKGSIFKKKCRTKQM